MAENTLTVPKKIKNPELVKLFEETQVKKAALLEELKPYRDDYERLVNDPRLIECKKKIKEINALISPLDQTIAALARALPGHHSLAAEKGVYETKMGDK